MDEIVPLWLVNVLAFTTVFSVMTSIGTTLRPSICFEYIRSPGLLGRGLFDALIFVPAVGILSTFIFGLSMPEKVGVALIVIAPGAPLALRRALASGGHAGFAPTLQAAVAILALPALPLWVEAANWCLGTRGIVDLFAVTRQISLAQLLPLALGAAARSVAPVWAPRVGKILGRAGAVLLIAAILTELLNLHSIIAAAQLRPVIVAVVTTSIGLAMGHLLGGIQAPIRHSIAMSSALRNVGLALLVAETNKVPVAVQVALLTYAITAIIVVSFYIVWYSHFSHPAAEVP